MDSPSFPDNHTYWNAILQAETTLRTGGIVVGPTDTVYGIFGDATNEETIEKIFRMKRRSKQKALPVFVRDIKMARSLAYISDAKARWLEHVWPGALTIIFHHKEKLPQSLVGGGDTIGLRIPNNPFLLKLLERLNAPIAQTSANVSGKAAARTFTDVERFSEEARPRPDMIIDGGVCAGMPSAVLDFTREEPKILRTGMMSRSSFDAFLRSIVRWG